MRPRTANAMDLKVCLLLLLVTCVNSREQNQTKPRRALRNRGATLEQLFTVYDPSFLALVWPKIANGVQLSLGHFCWEDMSVFCRDLLEGRAWTYNVVDASGRYQGGVFGGSTIWLGSKQRCLALDNEFLSRDNSSREPYEGEYLTALLQREKFLGTGGDEWRQLAERDELIQRLVASDHRPPHRLSYSVATVQLNLTKITMAKSYDITLGLCLPRSCTTEDVESIVTFSIVINDNLRSNRTLPRLTRVTALRHVDGYHVENDTGAIILIVITTLLLILSLTATAVELNLVKCRLLRPRLSRSVSFDLQKYNNTATHKRYYDEIRKEMETNIFKDVYPNLGKLNKIVDVNDMNVNAKPSAAPPMVTLAVTERMGSCNRCGKYKKQCGAAPTQTGKLPACPRVKYSSVASASSQEKRSNFLKKLLLCYSLRYSLRRVFNTNMANKDLAVTHLLRIVGTLWVMYVHVALIVHYIADDAEDVNNRNEMYYILTTGTLAFNTLLFASGVFSSHHFFYLKGHYTMEELVSFGGHCGQVLQFICFVTNRIIRLLPSYAYAILISGVLARWSRDTSALALPDGEGHNCDLYWWRNLLYITNVSPPNERCMQVSWYLSAESQLHVAGALLCALWSGARGRVAVAVTFCALVASTAADVSSAYVDIGLYLPGVYEAYVAIIERPWARVVPYFIGIFTGWMAHKAKGRLNVSKLTACCLWLASASTLVTSALIPWLALDWLTAWIHLTWPLALLWPTLVCATNYAPVTRRILDSGVTAAWSRLCYSMLLLHGCVARVLLMAADTALCSHPACVWSYFAGTTSLTLTAALLLSLLVEMPCCSLLRRLSDLAAV